MTDEVKDAPKVEKTEDVQMKVSDVIKSDEKKEVDKTVPEAVFLEEKKQRKALEKELKSIKARLEDGESSEDVSDDVDSIAEEYGVDKNFLKKLSKTNSSSISKEVNKILESTLKPFQEKERAEKIEKVFSSHFEKVIEEMPEYKDIVNKNVIKKLSLDPENADKTFQQLIEETYGKSIRGKKTLENTVPRGGKEPEDIDYDRASSDPIYFKEIMSDKASAKKYKDNLVKRVSRFL